MANNQPFIASHFHPIPVAFLLYNHFAILERNPYRLALG
jgi:hypothetical protein